MVMFDLIVSMIFISGETVSKTPAGTYGKPGTFVTFTYF